MEQIQFNAYEENVGFNPVEQIDRIPALTRKNQRLNRADEAALAQVRRNNQVKVKNAENAGKELEALATLSKKLGTLLGDIKKEQNDKEMEEGMMLAYTDGTDMTEFNQTESELEQAESAANQAADDYLSKGGDVFVSEKIRGLSGWKKYGYQKAMAQKAAYDYPAFYANAKTKATITIGDREISYDTPNLQPEEKAALDANIRETYLSQFRGYNPKFLNKYLFPAMQKFEAGEAAKFAAESSARIQKNRVEEAKDNFYAGLGVDPGQTFLDMADNKQGLFGSRKESRTAAVTLLEDYLKDDNIPLQERLATYERLTGHEFMHRGSGRTNVGKAFGRDFGRLEQVLEEIKYEGTSRTLRSRQDEAQQFQIAFQDEVKKKREAGEYFTDEDLKQFEDKWTELTGQEAPSWLTNYKTREDRDDEQDTERLTKLRRSRGYLIEGDLDNVSTDVYSRFAPQVQEDKSLAEVPSQLKQDAEERIKAATNDMFKDQIGKQDKTGEWVDFNQRAERAYQQKYQENILKGMSQSEAHNEALKSVVENAKVGTYLRSDYNGVNQEQQARFRQAQRALIVNPNAWKEEVLPGSEGALAAAMKYADTGVGEIPYLYRQLADKYKNVTAYDLMDAQLKAGGHSGMPKPKAEQEVDGMDPSVQRLLRFKPSSNKTRRALTEPGQLDAVQHNLHPSLQSFPTDVRDSVEGAQLIQAAGVPPRGAAWLSGNIQQESGWYGQRVWGEVAGDRSDRNGGLVSWMDGVAHNNFRLRRIEKHLGKSVRQASDAEQVQAMLWEMKTYYPGSYNTFMNPNSTDGQLIRASKAFWGYGHEGGRYQYARNIERRM